MADKAWKKLERKIGKLLGGERVKRMGDYAQSATDVLVPGLPWLKIDCKLRRALPLHALFRSQKDSAPALLTRELATGTELVSLGADRLAELLQAWRQGAPAAARIRILRDERRRYGHHALFREIEERYCRAPDDRAVLISKEHRRHLYLATVSPEFFRSLLRPQTRQNSALGVRAIRSRTASAGGLDS